MSRTIRPDRSEWLAIEPAERERYRVAVLGELPPGRSNTPIGVANSIGSAFRGHLVRECMRELERDGRLSVVSTIYVHDRPLPIYSGRLV